MPHLDESATELLIDVANRFYLQDKSKVQIASALGISRFRVARLLTEARDKGIVKIKIAESRRQYLELEHRLACHLKLSSVIIVDPLIDVDQERDSLAQEAARYLNSVVRPEQIIGLSWGRTLLPIASYLEGLPPLTFIQLSGVVGNDASQSPIEIISRIRLKSEIVAKALIAPLFASSPASTIALLSEPAVDEVMSYYKRLDIAVLSVGSWTPRVTQLSDSFEDSAKAELDRNGAIADFSGIFFDQNGKLVDSVLNDRRLSVSSEELANTPIVIAVAGGSSKTAAIHSVCMTGLATCLVTTLDVANGLMKMDAVKTPTWDRGTEQHG